MQDFTTAPQRPSRRPTRTSTQYGKKALATIGQDSAPSGLTAVQVDEWKNDLIAAQKAWNTFKDMDCKGARSFEYWGGTAGSLAVLNCQFEYTIARTNDLEARYLQQ